MIGFPSPDNHVLCYSCSSGSANTFEALLYCNILINMYWMTEWDENYLAWDWLEQIFFFTFILEWFQIFRKIMKILKNALYNILHNCNFYAVLSKLIKLALLLFYSLQTFFEFHHFPTYICFHVPRSNLGFNHHVSLSVSIWDYFWASFYIFVQIIECLAFLVYFIQKWKLFHLFINSMSI